ncbi:hypothetical protein HPB47_009104, partial [Ixodes persulcatus]
MSNCDSTITLLMGIAKRRNSELGAHLCTLGDIAGTPGPLAPLPALHTDPHPLRVSICIPRLRTKKSAAVVTARQLTESHLDAEYDGRTRVFTDGSVDPSGGTATAAAFFEAAAIGILYYRRAGGHMTCPLGNSDKLRTGAQLGNPERLKSGSRATIGARKGYASGAAHKDPGCPLSTVPRFSDAKLLVRRTTTRQNPDPRVAAGTFSARLLGGLDRHTAAVLPRLRIGSAFTPAWIGRFRPYLNPNCQTCQETSDAEHLLLHCTNYNDERTALHNAYSRLGLSSASLEEFLHPRATRA